MCAGGRRPPVPHRLHFGPLRQNIRCRQRPNEVSGHAASAMGHGVSLDPLWFGHGTVPSPDGHFAADATTLARIFRRGPATIRADFSTRSMLDPLIFSSRLFNASPKAP